MDNGRAFILAIGAALFLGGLLGKFLGDLVLNSEILRCII